MKVILPFKNETSAPANESSAPAATAADKAALLVAQLPAAQFAGYALTASAYAEAAYGDHAHIHLRSAGN